MVEHYITSIKTAAMNLEEEDRLEIIAGCLGFLLLCLIIMACKLSPHCWCHRYCPFRPRYKQMPEETPVAKPVFVEEAKYQSTSPQIIPWKPSAKRQKSIPSSPELKPAIEMEILRKSSQPSLSRSLESLLNDQLEPSRDVPVLVRGEVDLSVYYEPIENDDDVSFGDIGEPSSSTTTMTIHVRDIRNLIFRKKERGKLFLKFQAMKVEGNFNRLLKLFHLMEPEDIDKRVISQVQTASRNLKNLTEFKEACFLQLPRQDISQYCIRVLCCLQDRFSVITPLGESLISLEDVSLSSDELLTKDLTPPPQEDKGDILVSVNYLPTSQKLSVQPIECRNVHLIESTSSSNVYVKVAVVMKSSLSKRRTQTTPSDGRLLWEETLNFDLQVRHISDVSLVLSVRQVLGDAEEGGVREVTVGKVVLGLRSNSIKGQSHWREVVQAPRQWLQHWHVLRQTGF